MNSRSFVAFQSQLQTRHWCFPALPEFEARMRAPMRHRLVTQSLSTTWAELTSGSQTRQNPSPNEAVSFSKRKWYLTFESFKFLRWSRKLKVNSFDHFTGVCVVVFYWFCGHATVSSLMKICGGSKFHCHSHRKRLLDYFDQQNFKIGVKTKIRIFYYESPEWIQF